MYIATTMKPTIPPTRGRRGGSWTWRCGDGLAHRLARSGHAGPAFERRSALCHQDLQTVDHTCPSRPCRREEPRLSGSVDQVDHVAAGLERLGLERNGLERINVGVETDGGRVDDDLGGGGHRRVVHPEVR